MTNTYPIDTAAHKQKHRSLVSLLETAFKRHANKPAFTSWHHTLNYAQIDAASSNMAAYLQKYTNLQPGDRIAVQLPNVLQFPIVAYAALRAGLVLVTINPLYTARELHHQLADSGAKALVFLDMFADRVEAAIQDTQVHNLIMTSVGDMLPLAKRILINGSLRYIKRKIPQHHLPSVIPLRTALHLGKAHTCIHHTPSDAHEIALLQYTGGTTGVAKGAMLSHHNLISQLFQVQTALEQLNQRTHADYFTQGQDILIAPLPLYHIYAFTWHLLCMTHLGNHNILIHNPRDLPGMIRLMRSWPFTCFVGVSTLFSSLLNHPNFQQCNCNHLKITLAGGMATPSELALRWQHATQSVLLEGYGLTECSPIVAIHALWAASQSDSAGFALPETQLKTIHPNGEQTASGEAGELCVKGPQVMQGYWNNQAATQAAIDAEGWFRTGDIAIIQEDGSVRIVDRLKDMILVSGFNVFPNEIEQIANAHPDILLSAAIGVADLATGEAVKLFVVPKNPLLSEQHIIDWCKQQLTGYKVPKIVELRAELPTSPVGKILRKTLRAESHQAH